MNARRQVLEEARMQVRQVIDGFEADAIRFRHDENTLRTIHSIKDSVNDVLTHLINVESIS